MKYCFLTIGTWEGNAGYVRLREFGKELAKRGHSVTYIVDDTPYNRDTLLIEGTEKVVVPNRGLRSLLARRKAVRALKPDIVHMLDTSIKLYGAMLGQPFRFIVDWDEWIAKRKFSLVRGIFERRADKWARDKSFVAVVCSRYLQGEFKKLGCESSYIPYATYLSTYPDGESPYTEPTIVYMGNMYPAYDHDLIFDAALLLRDRGLSPRITILGWGPDLEKWRAFVLDKGLTNVTLPGFIHGEHLWRHLRHAHALLFPIRPVPLNLYRCPSKTFAYAQVRRPVIANRIGEVNEVLGEQAQYVPCTPIGFADAIAQVMQSPSLPDVDYHLERHNWSDRTDRLLEAIVQAQARSQQGSGI